MGRRWVVRLRRGRPIRNILVHGSTTGTRRHKEEDMSDGVLAGCDDVETVHTYRCNNDIHRLPCPRQLGS